jgi:hypothetical protein
MKKKSDKAACQHLSKEDVHRIAHELLPPLASKMRFELGLCPHEGLAVMAELTAIMALIMVEVTDEPSNPSQPKKKASKKKVKA